MDETLNNLVEMLEQSVQRFADRPALYDPKADGGYRTWTYAQLWKDVHKIAAHLQQVGVKAGDKVGLIAETRAFWPMADFAIMSLGACTVPVYPSLPANQVAHIVHHAEMRGIFVQNGSQLKKLLDIPREDIPNLDFVVLLEASVDDALKTAARDRFEVYELVGWLEQAAPLSEQEWKQTWQRVSREDLATIVYTSGTTGLPKGVMLSHGNLLANVEGIRRVIKPQPGDRTLSYLPLSHIFERTAGQFIPLDGGASIVYSRGFSKIQADFLAMPPTLFTTVPRLLEKVYEQVGKTVAAGPAWKRNLFKNALASGMKIRVEKQGKRGLGFALYDRLVFKTIRDALGGRVRMVIVGGAPMPKYAGEFFTAAGLTVVEGYGMTETSPVVAVNSADAPVLGTVGKVLFNVEAAIAKEDGELLVRGESITRGYYRNDEATKEAFTEDGWFKTGDVAEFTPDGYLRITDRKKNLIVLSTGKKVTPAPIEAEILKNPYIDQVLLLGQGYKFVSALVVPNEDLIGQWLRSRGKGGLSFEQWADEPSLKAFLLEQMTATVQGFAKFEQPKKLIVAREPFTVENNMLTPTLKVRARNVLEAYEKEVEQLYTQDDYEAPRVAASATNPLAQ